MAAIEIEVEIRWPDVDAYGHVSHMALVAIAEHGRSRWLDRVLAMGDATWPYIVARLEIDYRAPIKFEDRVAVCRYRPARIGNSSVRLEESINARDGRVVAELKSVIVACDEAGRATRPLTVDEAERLRGR